MNIDVDRQLLTPFSTVGDPDSPRTFLLSMGINSSAMEHSVFNHLLDLPAVSTARILALANSAGVPVYRIDSSNASTIVPLLTQSASIVSTVNSEIAAGRVVTIPRDPVSYFDWNGTQGRSWAGAPWGRRASTDGSRGLWHPDRRRSAAAPDHRSTAA